MAGASFSADAYRGQLLQLLPPGRAWPRDPGSVLGRLLGAFADALARVDGRAAALLDEADPSTALELLPDWERVVGIPDACVPVADTIGARQAAVVRKLVSRGGQSRAYLVGLAAALGASVTIAEFVPFGAGGDAGSRIYGDGWRFTWDVVVAPPDDPLALAASEFNAGSNAGDYLRTLAWDVLECVLTAAAPAGTTPIFSYQNGA